MFILSSILGAIINKYLYNYYEDYNKILFSDFNSYIVSIINSIIMTFISICNLYNIISNQSWNILSGINQGYLYIDLYRCIKERDYSMLMHHLFMTFTLFSPMYIDYLDMKDFNLNYVLSRIYICELTNVFLHSTIIMYKTDNTENILFKLCCILTIIGYITLRVYNFTWIEYYLYINEINICFILMMPITLLNYYWFYKLMKKYFNYNN